MTTIVIGFFGFAALGFAQPVILTQPQSQTNLAGTSLTLSVEATGALPLSYQWRKSTSPVAAATNAMLVFTNLLANNAGNYTVIITDVEGAVTSALAFVRVLLPPTITAQPTNFVTLSFGASVSNRVTATGTAPLFYGWRLNGTNLSGETNAAIVVTNLQAQNTGNYTLVVSNVAGAVTSQVASLTIDTTFTKITSGPVVTEPNRWRGCAWGDFDDDGYLDLVVAVHNDSSPEPLRLYRNNGPGPNGFTFTKVTNGPIATTLVNAGGMAWGDYDNDSQLDLIVPNDGSVNALFHNDGNGAFSKSTNAPVTTDGTLGDNAGWADYNRDGYVDLFVCNFNYGALVGEPDREPNLFYLNNGNGIFKKLTTNNVGSFLADMGSMSTVAWADYDNDGDPDLFITRPLNNQTSLLYRNDGNGTFTKMTTQIVGNIVNDGGHGLFGGSSGASWGDYDNDGDLDVFVAVGAESRVAPSNLLWRNNGNGTFTGMTTNEVGVIVGEPGTSTSCVWVDYDNDGWLDLFVTRPGYQGSGQDNLLYHNNGDGTFAKVITGSPVRDGASEWGLAWGDFDNDGFMDLFVHNGDNPFGTTGPQSNLLYRNNGNTNHWLKLKLIGTVSNRSAIGAKVRVKATIRGQTFWQLREISGSANRYGFQDMRPNFGLGDATIIETVRIEWPSGLVQELHGVTPNQFLTVAEPARIAVLGPGAFRIQCWKGMAFEVQASSDLEQWSPVTTVTNLTGTLEFTDHDATNHLQRFYRAVRR